MARPEYGFRVATFNIRNDTDRYSERKPLLVSAFVALSADLIGLQEVRLDGERQDDLLAAAAGEHRLRSFDARYRSHPDYGTTILAGIGEVLVHEVLPLSHGRPAHRILVALPGDRTLWFANTHLYHVAGRHDIRLEQVRALCEWMAGAPAATASIVLGDFNAPPSEPAYAAVKEAGYRSAFLEANGAEPPTTTPPAFEQPAPPAGGPACVDYIWLSGEIRARAAWVAADRPHPADPSLYPSDHFAVVADVVM